MEKIIIDSNNNNTILKIDRTQMEKIKEVKKKFKTSNADSSISLDHGSKYSYRLWNIKLSDLDAEEKYLRQRTFNFKLEAKFFRFSGFSSFAQTTLMFSKKKGLEITTNGYYNKKLKKN